MITPFSQYRAIALICLLALVLTGAQAAAYDKLPGKGTTVTPAQCTWNTGFFQAQIIHQGLRELGYEVKKARSLSNPVFYQALKLGDVDYWANGWFPNHENQLPKGFYDKADTVGYLVKGGAGQGYLVSKDAAEKYDITSLEDFKRPEVREAFDRNKDGKADLVACPPGWGCEVIVSHHMKVYDLEDHINPIKAVYAASIADALAMNRESGAPVLFYAWTPNWTVGKFKPGKDVVWINVPEINPVGSQVGNEEQMVVKGLEGAVTDPLKLGFVMGDLRVVANKAFMAENPAAQRFFQIAKIDLADINAQNSKMFEGEGSSEDIHNHVTQWIAAHQETWDKWLEEARQAAQ